MASNPKYDGAHRVNRSRLVPLVRGGTVRCARGEGCKYAERVNGIMVGGLIHAGEEWDLGHPDDGSVGGPEHPVCNRGAPHRRERQRGPMRHSRVW
jgi:hypothetical protein